MTTYHDDFTTLNQSRQFITVDSSNKDSCNLLKRKEVKCRTQLDGKMFRYQKSLCLTLLVNRSQLSNKIDT